MIKKSQISNFPPAKAWHWRAGKSQILRQRRNGFTLIELLVTIAIIGVLATVSMFALQGSREAGRDAKRKSDLEVIAAGLEMYKADCGFYPAAPLPAVNIALTGSACVPVNGNTYISQTPGDPNDPTRLYGYSRPTTATFFLCASLEQAPSATDPHSIAASSCTANSCGVTVTCNWAVRSP